MTVFSIIGAPGMGKTAWMTWCAMMYHFKGFKIYSNVKILNPFTGERISINIDSIDDLDKAEGGYLMIDEIMKWANARSGMSKMNKIVNNCLQVNRKRKLTLFYTTQDPYSVDILLRGLTDYVFLPEIKYNIGGRLIDIHQKLFDPINMDLLLPFTQLHVDMISGYKFFSNKATKQDVIEKFDIMVKAIVDWYDTRQEIDDLVITSNDKGDWFEKKCLELLQKVHPNIIWIRTEDSGHYQDTFDLEGWYDGQLKFIIDCTLSTEKKKNTHLIDFSKKPLDKFKRIEEEQHVKTFFMSNIGEKVYTYPVSNLLEVPEGHENYVKPKSKSIESLNNKGLTEYIGQIS